MQGTAANRRHQKPNYGPFRGMETNVFDDTQNTKGAVVLAQDVIFDSPRNRFVGDTSSSAQVRSGRHPWMSQQAFQRYYLSDAEEGNVGWDGNSTLDLTTAAAGYKSRLIDFPIADTIFTVKKFTAKDLTNDGQYTALSDFNGVFYLKVAATSGFPGGASEIRITSDAVPDADPANWNDYISKPINPAGMVDDTWTKFSARLDTYAETGTFDLTKVTAFAFILETDGTNQLWIDEIFVESRRVGHVVGLGEFYKPDTQDRFLLSKIGETIYIDKNHTGIWDKVVSNLDLNTSAYFQAIYNQILVSDGTDMWVIDGTKNSLGTWNYRRIGFPAPDVSGASGAPAAGTEGTVGNHHLGASYIYGNGTQVYGQSNVSIFPAVVSLSGMNLAVDISGLPVPPISAGVLRIRIFMWLAGDDSNAIGYFATEVNAGVTTANFDLSDVVLSAPTNPIAPTENNIPSKSRYLIPYEGSLIYLRTEANATVGEYSKRGVDLDSGPEVVTPGNIVANQNGQGWVGGISRNGSLYLFTRRSAYKGGFTPQGTLYLRQLEAENAGLSQFTGALDKNCIWLDDQNVIHVWGETGWTLIDMADKSTFFTREKLRDEWKDFNDREAKNTNSYHAWQSEADWDENFMGANLDADTIPGVLSYHYENTVSAALKADVGPFGTAEQEGNYGYYGSTFTPYLPDIPPGYPAVFTGSSITPGFPWVGMESFGATVWVLFQAKKPTRLSQIRLDGQLFNGTGITANVSINARINKFKYQNIDRSVPVDPTTFTGPLTNFVGAQMADVNFLRSINNGDTVLETYAFNTGDIFIPAGELFWVSIHQNTDLPFWINGSRTGIGTLPGANNLLDNWGDKYKAEGDVMVSPSGAGSLGIRCVCQEVLTYSFDATKTIAGADVERYALTNLSADKWHATGEVKVNMGVSSSAISVYTDGIWQALVGDYTYTAPPPFAGQPTIINGTPGFFVMPASRTGPDAIPPIIPVGYPNTSQNNFVAYNVEINQNSRYGYDILDESFSLISTDYFDTFLDTTANLLSLKYSAENSTFQEPLVEDTWISKTVDMGDVPVSWGRFTLNGNQDQQIIHLEAATAPTDDFSAVTWYPVELNTTPTVAQLPINGQFLQVRIRFEDDYLKGGAAGIYYSELPSFGISSQVNSLIVHWLREGSELRPMVPPAGVFYGRYSLISYAPSASILNNSAWCASPGYRLSKWTGQNVNCWLIYDNKLLAGMAGSGMVSQYWDNDIFDQDDATSKKNIIGRVISHPEKFGIDNVKTLSGITVFTGRREFQGRLSTIGTNPASVLPQALASLHFGFSVQSGLDPNVPAGTYAVIITPNLDYGYIDGSRIFGTSSGSTPLPIPALTGSYFFDLPGLQEEAFRFFWQASAHAIRIPAQGASAAYYRNCFPYLTKMVPEIFVENFGGVFQ